MVKIVAISVTAETSGICNIPTYNFPELEEPGRDILRFKRLLTNDGNGSPHTEGPTKSLLTIGSSESLCST